jgi:hypothetical protein
MSPRGWTGSIAAAIGLAAATGAAQLGVGYGLGAIGWLGDASGWAAALTWTVWVAALSVVIASLLARRRVMGSIAEGAEGGAWGRGLWRAAVACAAAIGGLAVVPLTALPARQVTAVVTSAPGRVGAIAVAGVLIGLVLAILALNSKAMAANLVATASWWWLVALVSVIDAAAAGRGTVTTQLGVWRFTDTPTGSAADVEPLGLPSESWWHSIYLPGAVLTVGAALVIGVLAALPAARRGESRVAVALSGLAGPALLAASGLLGTSSIAGTPLEQASALLVGPYAVLAGLAGSCIAAALGARRSGPSRVAAASAPVPADESGASPVDRGRSPRRARNDAARDRAARDAEARHAAHVAGSTATAIATAPVPRSGGQKTPKQAESAESSDTQPVVNNQAPANGKPLNGRPGKGRRP